MSKKITLIIDTIITPYEISRYNAINEALSGNLIVWFQAESDSNRHWKELPTPNFKFEVLKDRPIRLARKDIHTFHINPEVLKKLEAIKNDIEKVIICGWDSLTYWQAAYYCKRNMIPFVLWSGSTVHEKSWRRVVFMPIIKWIVKNASEYIAYGTRAKTFLHTLGAPLDKIKVFFNSVDLAYFTKNSKLSDAQRKQMRLDLGIPADTFVFLFIGQLIERKGVKDLLQAFRVLKRQNANVSLLMVGNGPLRAVVLHEQVLHIPHVEYSEVPALYGIADCLVLPSHEEVWGLVVNEAMAAGVPVIASDVVGASEDLVIHDVTGYVFRAGDTAELADCMSKMLKNAKRLGAEAAKLITKTDPATMAKQHFGTTQYAK